MRKITDEQIFEIADEYGESHRYIMEVIEDAESDGATIDEEFVRDFLEGLYDCDDTCELELVR